MKRPLVTCERCSYLFYAPRKNDGTVECPRCGATVQVDD